MGAFAGWLLVGLAWPRAALASDALWLLGVVTGGLAGLLAQALWRYGAVAARRRHPRGE